MNPRDPFQARIDSAHNGAMPRHDVKLPATGGGQTAGALPGLSAEETEEFVRLDQSLPFDGLFVWPDDLPAIPSEERWRLLWAKQCRALGL